MRKHTIDTSINKHWVSITITFMFHKNAVRGVFFSVLQRDSHDYLPPLFPHPPLNHHHHHHHHHHYYMVIFFLVLQPLLHSYSHHGLSCLQRVVTLMLFVQQTDTTVAKDRADSRMAGVDRDTDADSTMEHVHDVSTMSKEQRQQLTADLETTGTTSCLVLYEDNTTNTDSSVLNRPKVTM